ncbi:hypothetical protein STRDD04_02022 [Streptococcus sp. DD04]|nr:hypothetical protein STRDD04_02022 [Streptococcus sp. DD04]
MVCQSKFKHIGFEISTGQLLRYFETCFSVFSLISIFESAVVIVVRNACFKSSLIVIPYCDGHFDSLVRISDSFLSCTRIPFNDGISEFTWFVEFQFTKLNVSVCVICCGCDLLTLSIQQGEFEFTAFKLNRLICILIDKRFRRSNRHFDFGSFVRICECLNSGICNGVDGTRDWWYKIRTRC